MQVTDLITEAHRLAREAAEAPYYIKSRLVEMARLLALIAIAESVRQIQENLVTLVPPMTMHFSSGPYVHDPAADRDDEEITRRMIAEYEQAQRDRFDPPSDYATGVDGFGSAPQ